MLLIALRPDQEGRHRRLPGAVDRRPGVRGARGVRRARRVAAPSTATRSQIYCDFSGYTDIAIGLALLHGLRLPAELRPAVPRAELPRVLAALAHDAVALPARLPLHPARRQPGRPAARTARNLMLTMLLGGLWHGAAWGFVLWGGLHGAALVVEHALRGRSPRLPASWRWADRPSLRVPRLDPLPRRRPRHRLGRCSSGSSTPGPSTLWTSRRRSPWSSASSRSSSRPSGRSTRCASASRRSTRSALGAGAGGRRRARGAHGAQPGRPAVHLLPVLSAR